MIDTATAEAVCFNAR